MNLELTFENIRKIKGIETKIQFCDNCEKERVFVYTGLNYKCIECNNIYEKYKKASKIY
jgi:hypothetical protein